MSRDHEIELSEEAVEDIKLEKAWQGLRKWEEEKQRTLPAIADDTLVRVAESAEKRVMAMKKIKQAALAITNVHDWSDQNGKPYLEISGSTKIARLFGISWRLGEPDCEWDDSGHFRYTVKGTFELAGVPIEEEGSRGSKDQFFSVRSKWENGERTKIDIPPSEIDRGNVRKAAITNCLGRGVTSILGLRNLSYDDLEVSAGISRQNILDAGKGISYRRPSQGPKTTKPSQAKQSAPKRRSEDSPSLTPAPAQNGLAQKKIIIQKTINMLMPEGGNWQDAMDWLREICGAELNAIDDVKADKAMAALGKENGKEFVDYMLSRS